MAGKADKLFQEGQQLHQKGRVDRALRRYDQALEMEPTHVAALLYKGVAYKQKGRLREAKDAMESSLACAPTPGINHYVNYGSLLRMIGRRDEAAEQYEKALEINPNQYEAKNNLGVVRMQLRQYREALRLFEEIVADSELPEPWMNIGRIRLRLGDTEGARAAFFKALDLDPRNAEALANIGRSYLHEGEDVTAQPYFERACTIAPADTEALPQLLQLLRRFEEPEKALAYANAALGVDSPTFGVVITALGVKRSYLDWNGLDAAEDLIRDAAQTEFPVKVPQHAIFALLDARVEPEVRRQLGERYHAGIRSRLPGERVFDGRVREPDEKLKIGYLSSDLRAHAIGFLFAGMFKEHDRSRFEVIAYSNSFNDSTPVRRKIRSTVDRWINVATLDDREVAERMVNDGIDVLVDLNGYTRESRTMVLSHRPAPVQMLYVGMPGSTGVDFVDYFIGDDIAVNADSRREFTENILYLPRCYYPNDDDQAVSEQETSRADHGLPETGFVFCCFNQYRKITPEVFEVWLELLRQVPGSVLWMLEQDELGTSALTEKLESAGIAADRLVLAKKVANPKHLERTRHADLVLDTAPYNAHTTATDALRVGTPVLTAQGTTFAGRVAESILCEMGMPELVAEDLTAYRDTALRMARDEDFRGDIRARVKDAFFGSRLVDNADLARSLEAGYAAAYARWVQGDAPADIRVHDDYSTRAIDEEAPASEEAPSQPAPERADAEAAGETLADGLNKRLFGEVPFAQPGEPRKEPDQGGWFEDESVVLDLIDQVKPRIMIEVGVWKGRSALRTVKHALGHRGDVALMAVDTFEGNDLQWLNPHRRQELEREHGFPTIYETFRANVIAEDLVHHIVPVPLPSRTAARVLSKLADGAADYIYIDAGHAAADVADDIRCFWPLLRPGGVMVGDDYDPEDFPGVIESVEWFFGAYAAEIDASGIRGKKWFAFKLAGDGQLEGR